MGVTALPRLAKIVLKDESVLERLKVLLPVE